MNLFSADKSAVTAEWIAAQRPGRNVVDALHPFAFFEEIERSATGTLVPVSTIFLTNRECRWRCLHCDLWKNTLTKKVPRGAIPAQIDHALAKLNQSLPHSPATARHLKLYNSGSFFDPGAIPLADYPAIAARLAPFEHVIVESHPALVGDKTLRLQDLLSRTTDSNGRHPTLEVAMGLETAHPEVLARLNKGMTLEQFQNAAEFLKKHQIALRTFLLVHPPFLKSDEAILWTLRSVEFSFRCGSSAVSLIPTRLGNGALDALAQNGEFSPPAISVLEKAAEYGLSLHRGRVFADLWDLKNFSQCPTCFDLRRTRLQEMNWQQISPPPIDCPDCDQTF